MLSYKHTVFLEVATQLSFTKASEVLFISQPAVTKHIQQLEEYYNVRLFSRTASSTSLSPAGKILYNFLLKAKDLEKEIEFEMATLKDQFKAKGTLKLGASTTVALYIIPAVLSGFRQKYPEVEISLLNRNSENILKALQNQEIDLGIMEGKSKMKMVHTEHFLTDEVIPVCSPKGPLAKKRKFTLAELPSIPVALREQGSGTLSVLKSALLAHSIKLKDLNTVLRLGGTEALKNFVLADNSLGFLPTRAVSKELENGDLVRIYIDGLTITRQFFFITRQGDKNNKLSSLFIKFAKGYYNIKL